MKFNESCNIENNKDNCDLGLKCDGSTNKCKLLAGNRVPDEYYEKVKNNEIQPCFNSNEKTDLNSTKYEVEIKDNNETKKVFKCLKNINESVDTSDQCAPNLTKSNGVCRGDSNYKLSSIMNRDTAFVYQSSGLVKTDLCASNQVILKDEPQGNVAWYCK